MEEWGTMRRLIGVSFLIVVFSTVAQSATRSVPFLSMSDGKSVTGQIGVTTGMCNIVIYNSSTTASASNQIIDQIEVLQLNAAGSATLTDTAGTSLYKPLGEFAASSLPLNTIRVNDGGTSTALTSCVSPGAATALLKPGAFCLIQYQFFMLPFTNDVTVCAGRIRVRDELASKPGSILASGSIMITQESRVLRGVLMGAFYQTPPLVMGGGATVSSNTDYADNSPWDLYLNASNAMGTTQISASMNVYCTKTCSLGINNAWTNEVKSRYQEGCNALCGYKPTTMPPGGAATPVNYGTSFVSQSRSSPGTYNLTTAPPPEVWLPTSGSGGLSASEDLYATGQMFARNQMAYYGWGGGMVNEMVLGPFDAICNGNETYLGVRNFTHAHSGFKPSSEYLYCAHHHNNLSLTSGVEMTLPFQINSGLPF